jgi:hypothetical protein
MPFEPTGVAHRARKEAAELESTAERQKKKGFLQKKFGKGRDN